MDTRTNHNGSAKEALHVIDRTRSAAKRSKPSAKKTARKLATSEPVQRVLTRAQGLWAWMKLNPKTTIGVLVGAGVLIGVGARTRVGRSALLGLSGLATVVAKRYF